MFKNEKMTAAHAIGGVAALLIGLSGAPAAADIMQQFPSFGPAQNFAVGIDQFDPNDGALDEVRISISGQLTYSVFAPAWLDALGNPMTYDFSATVDHDILGSPGGFSFGSPAQFIFNGTASGLGDTFTFSRAFTYDFDLTAATDLLGGAPLAGTSSGFDIAPFLVTGTRADFVADPLIGPITIQEQNILSVSNTVAPVALATTQLVAGGLYQVTYEFTPPVTPDPGPGPTAVPEPGGFGFVALALAALAAWRSPGLRRAFPRPAPSRSGAAS